jgi:hypothetical protein
VVSLYRQPGRVAARTLALAASGALVVGLAGGYAIGRGTAPAPTVVKAVAALRSDLRPVEQGIVLAPTEYGQAVRGGRVVAPTEYQAARADVQRAQDAVDRSRAELSALDAARAQALERAVAGLGAAVARRADAAEIQRLAAAAGQALSAAVGRTG